MVYGMYCCATPGMVSSMSDLFNVDVIVLDRFLGVLCGRTKEIVIIKLIVWGIICPGF